MLNFSTSEKRRSALMVLLIAFAIYLLYPSYQRFSGGELATSSSKADELLSSTPQVKVAKPLSLGLDLSGGVHLVYKVIAEEAVKSKLLDLSVALKTILRDNKVAVTKIETTESSTGDMALVINLLSDSFLEKAKSAISSEVSDLQFVSEKKEEGSASLVYKFSNSQIALEKQRAINQAVETLRNRVDQFGVSEPLIQRVGEDRILLQMPGVKDVDSVKKIVGKIAKLEFRLIPSGAGTVPTITLKNTEGSPVEVEEAVQMTGSAIQDARVSFDERGQPIVNLTFNSSAAKTFASLTGANVGRQLAIILDGVLYSAPQIQSSITGGKCQISGNMTMQDSKDLAVVLRSGALPAPLEVMEQKTVGPMLGAESIKKGIFACLLGLALITVFMICYYKKSGIVAVCSLVLNLLLIVALLSMLGATLTLPGLAGLALTIGMAVDSSVIIFERIKDEIREGAGRDLAVKAGFEKAFSAIADSNITTLLTAIILYYYGTGPVKGFAVTLSIGIFTTVFCAIVFSRLLFDIFPLTKGNKDLSI